MEAGLSTGTSTDSKAPSPKSIVALISGVGFQAAFVWIGEENKKSPYGSSP